jgi:lysyl-tRNA synthetase class 2
VGGTSRRSGRVSMDPAMLKKRARFLQETRAFFIDGGYLEVDTPLLAPFLLPEPSLEVFQTQHLAPDMRKRKGFLAPSPEIWMKRLLARGSGSIFQIGKSFRNMEFAGRHHNPEFTLLEWYTVGHDYRDSMGVMEDLLRFLREGIAAGSRWSFPIRKISMKEAFTRYADLSLDDLLEEEPLRRAVSRAGIDIRPGDGWEELFHKLFLAKVEPSVASHDAVILYDYPAAIPTTAKAVGGYAERWEIYIQGVEVANCYTEETDPRKLRRFLREEAERKKRCRVLHPVDWQFAELFPEGFPTCSGVALGMDRLFMVICGAKSIEECILFPFREMI